MPARVLNGLSIAAAIRSELPARIAAMAAAFGRTPGLGIVLAGNDAGSEIYVCNKLTTADALLADASTVLRGSRRCGECPPLWDGKTAERILTAIEDYH